MDSNTSGVRCMQITAGSARGRNNGGTHEEPFFVLALSKLEILIFFFCKTYVEIYYFLFRSLLLLLRKSHIIRNSFALEYSVITKSKRKICLLLVNYLRFKYMLPLTFFVILIKCYLQFLPTLFLYISNKLASVSNFCRRAFSPTCRTTGYNSRMLYSL